MLLYPGKQFSLNIIHWSSRLCLTQWSCAFYQTINPILRVSIFNASFCLKILHVLSNSRAGYPDLLFHARKGLTGRTRSTRLKMLQYSEGDEEDNISAYLEQTMIALIRLFEILSPPCVAFPAKLVSQTAYVTADIILSRVVSWTAIDVDLESYLCSRCSVADLYRFLLR